eukprot:c16473_g1_i2.p1 GENE.c16473_g1_i2~~c16473_g1_i2.p1  ORF type:complete len:197 (+),score=52.04 c16473_g1_i2:858-1448(+)
MNKTIIAQMPLVVYLASMLTTFGMRKLNTMLGRRTLYITGNIISILAFVAFNIIAVTSALHFLVFPVCALLGVGTAISLVAAVTMQADLLGTETTNAAFVYGLLSFGDKVLNGFVIALVELLRPECAPGKIDCQSFAGRFFIHVMSGLCAVSAVIALLFCISVPRSLFKDTTSLAIVDVEDETLLSDDETKPLIKN